MTLSTFQPSTGPAPAVEKAQDRKYQRMGLIIELAKLLRQDDPGDRTEDLLSKAARLVDKALIDKQGPLK